MAIKQEICQELIGVMLEKERVTRSDFIKKSGYRPASVLEAVDALKECGLVIEPERSGLKTGRQSPVLAFNPEAGSMLGIEIEPDKLRFAQLDLTGNLIAGHTRELAPGATAEDIRHALAVEVSRFSGMLSIGIADPGLVDKDFRKSLGAVGIPGWEDVAIGEFLSSICQVPEVTVLPECGARAFGEYMKISPDKRDGSLFLLHLDRGVGAGFIQEGRIFRGDNCRAMELGHLVVKPGGPICGCGSRGCLEALVGEAGVIRRVEELLDHNVRTCLKRENLSLSSFVEAVKSRDRAAELLAQDLCREISPVFPMIATLLNPARLVLSGTFSGIGHMLLEHARKLLDERCLRGTFEGSAIYIAEHDIYDAAKGAALFTRPQAVQRICR